MNLPAGYRSALEEIFSGPHEEAVEKQSHTPPPGMPTAEHMIEAQALWDATMADSIAQYMRRHPGSKVMQMNGAMHSDYGWAIAARLHKLLPQLHILIVSIQPEADYPVQPASKWKGVGDYLILTPPVASDEAPNQEKTK